MKDPKYKYYFKTLERHPGKDYCHYSGLPSPSAYEKDDVDYDGMGNQGRIPIIKKPKKNRLKNFFIRLFKSNKKPSVWDL